MAAAGRRDEDVRAIGRIAASALDVPAVWKQVTRWGKAPAPEGA